MIFSTLQDLMTALKGALSGSLEALMLGLMRSTTQYDAFELKNSVKVQRGRDNLQLVQAHCDVTNVI